MANDSSVLPTPSITDGSGEGTTDDDSDIGAGPIALIAIGCAVAAVLLLLLFLYLAIMVKYQRDKLKLKKRRKQVQSLADGSRTVTNQEIEFETFEKDINEEQNFVTGDSDSFQLPSEHDEENTSPKQIDVTIEGEQELPESEAERGSDEHLYEVPPEQGDAYIDGDSSETRSDASTRGSDVQSVKENDSDTESQHTESQNTNNPQIVVEYHGENGSITEEEESSNNDVLHSIDKSLDDIRKSLEDIQGENDDD